jgi:hypothetical protein
VLIGWWKECWVEIEECLDRGTEEVRFEGSDELVRIYFVRIRIV